MAIRFTCTNPSCGQSVRAPDSAAGKKAKCPYCQAVQSVPANAGDQYSLSQEQVEMMVQAAAPAAPPPQRVKGPSKLRPLIVGGMIVAAVVVVAVAVIFMMKKPPSPAAAPGDGASTDITTGVAARPSPVPTAAPTSAVPLTGTPPLVTGMQPAAVPPVKPTSQPAVSAATTPAATTAAAPPGPTPAPIGALDRTLAPTPVAPPGIANLPAAYVGTVLLSKPIAAINLSKSNLVTFKQTIDRHALMNEDKYPTKLEDLVSAGEIPAEMLKSPGDRMRNYVFLSGTTANSPKSNIMIYDPHVYASFGMAVITVDGTTATLSPADLKKKLVEQKAKAEEIP